MAHREIQSPGFLERQFHPAPTRRLLLVMLLVLLSFAMPVSRASGDRPSPNPPVGGVVYLPMVVHSGGDGNIVIGWNSLGIHFYDLDYTDMGIQVPYNTLMAQVIQRGDPPRLVTEKVSVTYSFQDNSESATKTNFFVYSQKLLGLAEILPPDVGLTGKGLAGEMDRAGSYFIAEGIPLTEFRDSAPGAPSYYQLADLVARDATSGYVLDSTTIVAGVSSEMRCYDCHTGPYTNFRWNILAKHDQLEQTSLMSDPPVLCARCHADAALGTTGEPGVPPLSTAIHRKHAEVGVGPGNCYACHPGPATRFLRDVMSHSASQIWCTDCHGHLADVGSSHRTPWVDEPRCGNCHDAQHAENPNALYRNSTGHGGLFCATCHNSQHAVLPSRVAEDNLQAEALQGYAGTIQNCRVCHTVPPNGPGAHE